MPIQNIPTERVHVEYLREVTSPHFLEGKKGDKKHLAAWHAAQLLEEGFVRRVEDPTTGEVIDYPPEPVKEDKPKAGEAVPWQTKQAGATEESEQHGTRIEEPNPGSPAETEAGESSHA